MSVLIRPLSPIDSAVGPPSQSWVAEVDSTRVGFLEARVRSTADACGTYDPVGYVERWNVEAAHRRRGIGRALVDAAIAWTRSRGLSYLAADAPLEDEITQQALVALGFEIGGRSVNLSKKIGLARSSAPDVRVVPLDASHRERLLAMRMELWPDHALEEEAEAVDAILAGRPLSSMPLAISIAELSEGEAVGFVEHGLRSWAEGCTTSPVGYIEGWFVDANVRRRGIGGALLSASEEWARAHGCTEMGSDAELGNDLSVQAHEKLGYAVAARLVNLGLEL